MKNMKKMIFVLLSLIVLTSLIPASPVQADGNNPIGLEVCVTWGKKNSMMAGIHIWVPDNETEIFGKTVQFDLVDGKNPNYIRFGELIKSPGKGLYIIPEDFISDWSKMAIPLTNAPQTLNFTVYNYDNSDSMTLIYEIPSIDEAISGIQNSIYGPCLGDWYN